MPKKGKGAAVELPPANCDPWEAHEKLTVDREDALVSSYGPSGDFKTDYLAYCKIWHLTPHPQIVRSWKAIQYEADERQKAEEAAKAEADRLAGIVPDETAKKKKKKKKKKRRAPERDPDQPVTDADLFDMKPQSTLSVRGHRLDSNHTLAVSLALPHCEKVTTIKFWNAGLGAAEIEILAGALPSCASVRSVYIDWNPLPEAEVPIVAAGAGAGAGAGAEEDGGKEGGDEGGDGKEDGGDGKEDGGDGKDGAEAEEATPPPPPPAAVFAKLINNEAPLSYLSLRGNNLAQGLTAIAANLRINTTLSSINLFGNKIGDGGLAVLAPALRDNRTVSSLSLGDNSLTNACAPVLASNLLHYSLTEEEVAERAAFEESLGGGDKKKKKGKGDADATGLPPLRQVKGVWYGRGSDKLKWLDLSQNGLGSQGVAELLGALYPAPEPEPEPVAAPEPEPEPEKKGKKGGKKKGGKKEAPPPVEKLDHIVAAIQELDVSANGASGDDTVDATLPVLPTPPAPEGGEDEKTGEGGGDDTQDAGAAAGAGAGAGAGAASAEGEGVPSNSEAPTSAGGPPSLAQCLRVAQQLAPALSVSW